MAPVSVPLEAAGSTAPGTSSVGASGISDVGIGVVGNTSALDQKSDARLSSTQGDGEHKASVGSSGISTDPAATPAPQAPLPTNHPYTKKQLDELKKRQEAAMKAQQKAAAEAAKKCAKTPTATGCTAPAVTTGVPSATPPGAAAPASVPASGVSATPK
jgi:hypothetical protein